MKRLLTSLLILVSLVGCNPQQEQQVNDATKQAQKSAQEAVDTAKEGMTDASLTARVKTAMGASDQLKSTSINVDTENRVVHLKGTVPTGKEKILAERIARDTVGPEIVVMNELEIRAP